MAHMHILVSLGPSKVFSVNQMQCTFKTKTYAFYSKHIDCQNETGIDELVCRIFHQMDIIRRHFLSRQSNIVSLNMNHKFLQTE